MHADQYASHPRILALRDRYEKVGSPFLGFTAGLGRHRQRLRAVAHRGLPPPRRVGGAARPRSSTCGTRTTSRARPPTRPSTASASASFIGLAAQNGRPDLGIDFGINGTGLFGPARVDDWLEIMPWIRHVHGKFFGIDENGEEPSVPVRDLVRLLVENGYSGAISSEYEGWHWNYWQSPFDIIRGEQAVQRSAAADAGSRMITDAAEARGILNTHLAQPVRG